MNTSDEQYVKPEQILVMTIQIDDKRTGKIDVYDGDDPEVLARDFCIRYGVNQRIVGVLMDNILKNVQIAMQERLNMKQYLSSQHQHRDSHVSNTQPSPRKNQSVESTTVYDRLYQDAHHKKMKKSIIVQDSRVKRTITPQESDRGLKKREELNLKAESARKDMQLSQLSHCTHQPQINEVSKQIARRSPEPVGHHLNKLARSMQEKKDNALNAKLEVEQMSCSFHPQINKISQYIVEEKKKQSNQILPHYEALYQDYDTMKNKLQQLDQNYFSQNHTFHPKIDPISEQIVSGIGFEERQVKFRYQSKQSQSVDENQLFKPKTGRPPENRPADLFQTLYDHASQQAQSKQFKLSESREKQVTQSRTKANAKSDLIMQQSIQQSLGKLFDQLDTDCDGEIDANRIDVNGVDAKVLSIVKPLLMEMEEGHHILNRSEFLESATRLYYSLSIKERHELLQKTVRKSSTMEYSFHPSINQRSQRIVAARRN